MNRTIYVSENGCVFVLKYYRKRVTTPNINCLLKSSFVFIALNLYIYPLTYNNDKKTFIFKFVEFQIFKLINDISYFAVKPESVDTIV